MSDEQLRERFRALRREQEQAAPDFGRSLARAREDAGGHLGRGWLWASALAGAGLAAAVLFALTTPRPERPPAAFEPGRWALPTDVLLELPGWELLRDVPSIGTPMEGQPSPRRTGALRRPLA